MTTSSNWFAARHRCEEGSSTGMVMEVLAPCLLVMDIRVLLPAAVGAGGLTVIWAPDGPGSRAVLGRCYAAVALGTYLHHSATGPGRIMLDVMSATPGDCEVNMRVMADSGPSDRHERLVRLARSLPVPTPAQWRAAVRSVLGLERVTR